MHSKIVNSCEEVTKGMHQCPQMSYVYPEEPEHGHTLRIECNKGEQNILLNAVL